MAESRTNAYLDPKVLAQITKLGLRATRVVEGTISGLHRSPMHGLSPEFADHREYTPGDDLKNLDWRVYARTGRHYIKRFEEESNLRATILLDASGSMRYGGDASPSPRRKNGGKQMSKLDYAATLAASLSMLMVKQRDAVGLATFDTQPRTIMRPAATALQLTRIIDVLERTEPQGETDLGEVIVRVADRIKRRGLVILISDMLADLESLYAALGKLQYGGHEVLVLQVLHPDETDMPFNDSIMFRDIEGSEEILAEPWAFRKAYRAAMEQFIGEVSRHCRFCGIDHLLLKTDEDLGLALSHYLHRRQRQASSISRGRMSQMER